METQTIAPKSIDCCNERFNLDNKHLNCCFRVHLTLFSKNLTCHTPKMSTNIDRGTPNTNVLLFDLEILGPLMVQTWSTSNLMSFLSKILKIKNAF